MHDPDFDHGPTGAAALARSSAVRHVEEADGEWRGQHRDGRTYARRYDGPDPAEPHYRAWRLHEAGQLNDRQGMAAARLADAWAASHVHGAHARGDGSDEAGALDRWHALMRDRRDADLLERLVHGGGPGWRLRALQAALDALADEWGMERAVRGDGDTSRIRSAQVST